MLTNRQWQRAILPWPNGEKQMKEQTPQPSDPPTWVREALKDLQAKETPSKNDGTARCDEGVSKNPAGWFPLPGAFLVYARRNFMGFWKTHPTPLSVLELGPDGLSFVHVGEPLKPGLSLRLTIMLLKWKPIRVTGVVVSNTPQCTAGSGTASGSLQTCAVKFVDYHDGAWQALRTAKVRHANASAAEAAVERRRNPQNGAEPPAARR